MAEDPKAPEEEAHPAPEKPAKRPRKGRPVDPPVSLFPLSFEEAVEGLLQVPFERDPPEKPEKK